MARICTISPRWPGKMQGSIVLDENDCKTEFQLERFGFDLQWHVTLNFTKECRIADTRMILDCLGGCGFVVATLQMFSLMLSFARPSQSTSSLRSLSSKDNPVSGSVDPRAASGFASTGETWAVQCRAAEHQVALPSLRGWKTAYWFQINTTMQPNFI